MSDISKLFESEINLIKSGSIQSLITYILDNRVPEYFLINKSSSSGKYHPLNKNGDQENLIEHSKSVFRVLWTILDHPDLKNRIDQRNKDCVLSAALLHDTIKYGFPDEQNHTVHEHPVLVKMLIDDNIIANEQWVIDFNEICRLISSHHGPWRTSLYSELILPQITDELQWYLHLSDYLASREYVRVDYDYDIYERG